LWTLTTNSDGVTAEMQFSGILSSIGTVFVQHTFHTEYITILKVLLSKQIL